MCGIAGVFSQGGLDLSVETLVAMRDQMTHRGPDDCGVHSDPAAGLGLAHRRLSIVDLSPAGRQPMFTDDGSALVYNGEIYNHTDLRPSLAQSGYEYSSATDSETLLYLCHRDGVEAALPRLRGMFAFAYYDARSRELHLVRDRLGVKPLYWSRRAGGTLFASEAKGILAHPAVSTELDREALADYLTFFVSPAPRTMFAGIEKLAPAEHVVVGADGSISRRIWWTPFSDSAAGETADLSDAEAADELVDRLRQSMKLRTMADVPYGVLLSGGVDSGTNLALLAEGGHTVRTFSIAFEGAPELDETPQARALAEHFGADHHETRVTQADLEGFLPDLARFEDEPLADWVCFPLYFVSRLAKSTGTTVVQVGEGSDEVLHGYGHYARSVRLERLARRLRWVPGPAMRATGAAGMGLSGLLGRGGPTFEGLYRVGQGRPPFWGAAIAWRGAEKQALIPGAPEAHRIVERVLASIPPEADSYQRVTALELSQRLAELLLMRVDKMTMATSVEARVPFLDHEYVEWALSLPPRFKVRNGTGKWLLREASRRYFPPEVPGRPKRGFGAPVSRWLRGGLGERLERAIGESGLARAGGLNLEVLGPMWAEHRAGRADRGWNLWLVANAALWYDHYFEGDRAAELLAS